LKSIGGQPNRFPAGESRVRFAGSPQLVASVAVQFRQLLPDQRPVEIEDLLGSLKLGSQASDDRPYTVVNFVSSADGRATLEGRSGGLGDDGDRAMFHGLREQVDAVMAGTGTLRTERYGRLLGKPERRQRRAERGLAPEPLACMVTRSGEVPTGIPLFAEPEALVAVFSPVEVDVAGCAAQVKVVRLDPGELTLTTVLRALRRDFGVRSLLCEGGPTLFASMLAEGVVDELFLTMAPLLAGGGMEPAITAGPELADPAALSISWLLEREASLYLRYALRQSS
jgi:riboflavin biosynthesis pyrimidine reductase